MTSIISLVLSFSLVENSIALHFTSMKEEANEENVTSRYNRIKCYKVRDAFFSCLDNLDGESKDFKECNEMESAYHQFCMPSWVKVIFSFLSVCYFF